MEIRCAACTARFNIYKVAAFNGKRECTSCQTPIGYIDPETVSVTLTSRYVAAQDGSGGPSAGFERMPFMFHYDIMTSKARLKFEFERLASKINL